MKIRTLFCCRVSDSYVYWCRDMKGIRQFSVEYELVEYETARVRSDRNSLVSSRERLTRGKAFSELLCRSLLVSPNRDTYLPANTVQISRLLTVKRWTSIWYIAHNLAFHMWRSYLSPSLPTVTIFSYCIDDSGKHWELGKSDFVGKTYRFWRSKKSIICPT